MLGKMGFSLGKYFTNKRYIEESDIDAVRYWFEIIINEYVILILNVILGYLMGIGKETIVYLIIFITLRKFIPGYHCSTILRCNVLSFSLCFAAMYFARHMDLMAVQFLTIVSSTVLFVHCWNTSNQSGCICGVLLYILVFVLCFFQQYLYLGFCDICRGNDIDNYGKEKLRQ